MTKQILKTILIGILTGIALFMAPFFLIKFFFFFLIIGAIFKLMWGGRRRRWGRHYHYAYADHIRNMSDEEYAAFKNKWNNNHCGPHHYHGYYSTQSKNDSDNQTKVNNDKTE